MFDSLFTKCATLSRYATRHIYYKSAPLHGIRHHRLLLCCCNCCHWFNSNRYFDLVPYSIFTWANIDSMYTAILVQCWHDIIGPRLPCNGCRRTTSYGCRVLPTLVQASNAAGFYCCCSSIGPVYIQSRLLMLTGYYCCCLCVFSSKLLMLTGYYCCCLCVFSSKLLMLTGYYCCCLCIFWSRLLMLTGYYCCCLCVFWFKLVMLYVYYCCCLCVFCPS